MNPQQAFYHAYDNHTEPDFDLEKYQKISCTSVYYAYQFAKYIPGADINICRNACLFSFSLDDFDKMIIEKSLQ